MDETLKEFLKEKPTIILLSIMIFLILILAGTFVSSKINETPIQTSPRYIPPQPTNNTNHSGNKSTPIAPILYTNSIQLSMIDFSTRHWAGASIPIDHGYIQYKIHFNQTDSINVNVQMTYGSEELIPLFYVVILTDGANEITNTLFLPYNPIGKIDWNQLRGHNALRGHWIMGRYNLSGEKNFVDTVNVQKNDTWYLTVAIHNQGNAMKYLKDNITVDLKGNTNSMNITVYKTSGELEYFIGQTNVFGWNSNNRFVGVGFGKKSLGFGFMKATKTILVSDGMVCYCSIDKYTTASITAISPDGTVYSPVVSGSGLQKTSYIYLSSNQTGNWTFNMRGLSLGVKLQMSLFYMDVDIKGTMRTK